MVVPVWGPNEGEKKQSPTWRQSGQRNSLLFMDAHGWNKLFVLLGPSTDWMRPTHLGEGHLLYSVYPFKCCFHSENTHSRTPRIMFNQMPEHLVPQPSWHIKLTITATISLLTCQHGPVTTLLFYTGIYLPAYHPPPTMSTRAAAHCLSLRSPGQTPTP
jgi:hypothetical protein